MAKWVRCTVRSGEETTEVYVNLKLAAWVIAEGEGSRIAFAGDDDVYLDVLEKPQEVLSKLVVKE